LGSWGQKQGEPQRREYRALAAVVGLGCLSFSAACADWPGGDEHAEPSGADGRVEAALTNDAGVDADWQQALGSPGLSVSSSGVVDAERNALVTGNTDGALGGDNAGSLDAFAAKYSPNGGAIWARQFGSGEEDTSAGVSVDASGSVFIAGATAGNLGGAAAGFGDAFVAKYSADGAL